MCLYLTETEFSITADLFTVFDYKQWFNFLLRPINNKINFFSFYQINE